VCELGSPIPKGHTQMSLLRIKQLRENRARAYNTALTLIKKDKITTEDRASFDRAMAEVDSFGDEIRRLEGNTNSARIENRTNPDHAIAFNDYLRNGAEMRDASKKVLREMRDQQAGTQSISYTQGAAGGYLVPSAFVYEVEQATKYFCNFLDGNIVRVIETATGNLLPFPTGDDTGNSAVILGENQAASEQDVAFGSVAFKSYKLTSGVVKASIELLEDGAFNFETYLAERFGERYGRGLENYLTNGTGVNQPTGILTALNANGAPIVVAKGSSANDGSTNNGANSIGYGDLVNLEHAVDPTYRNAKSSRFMFHDQTLAFLKTLLDKFGRPLWTPGITADQPDTILGHEYVVNQSMPQIGASAQTVIFGDLSKFVVRKVAGLYVQRLSELYANTFEIGFQSAQRVDSNLVTGGGKAIASIQQHS
jgi:HK97 family phage major capsid protein